MKKRDLQIKETLNTGEAKLEIKFLLRKPKDLTADEVLQILVGRLHRLDSFKVPSKREPVQLKTQVFGSIGEYDEAMQEVRLNIEFNKRVNWKIEQKRKLTNKVTGAIKSFLPKYHWFKVPIKDKVAVVGISTSDWGGGESTLHTHIWEEGMNLRELRHTIN